MQRTYNAGSHQYKGCYIQPSSFVNDICIYVNHVSLTLCAFLEMWQLLSWPRNCLFLFIIMFTKHFTGPRWVQFKPPHPISLFSYAQIYQFLHATGQVRRHVIHFMYVKWGKAANTLWNQERIKQGFYEAEQVTAVTALVMTNIYVMMNE